MSSPPVREKIYYGFFDGLRGLAGLGVVFGHMYTALLYFSPEVQVPRRLAQALGVFSMGQTRLDLFIVLSGYCLSMPAIRAGGVLRDGTSEYFKRRASRILIPYYAALIFTLFMIWFARTSGLKPATPIDFDPAAIASHVLLVHNFSQDLFETLNPPLWSIAVEWQLYFFLPFLILPLLRRLGPVATVLIAFGLGLAPHFLLNGALDWTRPWFLGLFALGGAGAWVSFSAEPRARWLRDRIPWGSIALVTATLAMGYCFAKRGFYHQNKFLVDPIIGVAATALLIYCERNALRATLVVRVLSSRILRWFGKFSYSLFLVHYPVLVVFWFVQLRIAMSASARVALMFSAGFGLILLVAYAFYLAVERPAMRYFAGKRKPVTVLAPLALLLLPGSLVDIVGST